MPVTRNKFQQGSLELVKRKNGLKVWVFRWRETNAHGQRVQRKQVVGDEKEYRTRAAAQSAIQSLRAAVNAKKRVSGVWTLKQLWDDFATNELRNPQADRSETTIKLYEINANHTLLPQWGGVALDQITAPAVEKWLASLSHAPSTKAKFRNQLSALFNHGIRYGHWTTFNPITGPSKGSGVRQSAKRLKAPDILSLADMQAVLSNITSEPVRVAVLIAAVTGLRRSEIRGLKWKDIDFNGLWLDVQRGKIGKLQSKLKTEASRKKTPITRELAEVLAQWRDHALYPGDEDWVFGSEQVKGREPMWFDIMLKRHVRPAAKEAGISKSIGWHTWRRSLASLLADRGEDVKVVQELLRHANSKITLELYQQGSEKAKRAAQAHVKELFLMKNAAS
jgi:integrase